LSAICGLYFKNTQTDPGAGEAVMKELGKYQFDKSATICQDPVFFGCHLNWVTPESVHEILPFADDQAQLMITADAIIDNREELCELLSVSDGSPTSQSQGADFDSGSSESPFESFPHRKFPLIKN